MIAGLAVALHLAASGAPLYSMEAFSWMRRGDSLSIVFGFAGEPPRYRIRPCPLTAAKACLLVEFSEARMDPAVPETFPHWIRVEPSDSAVLQFRVALTEPTPWRLKPQGASLRIDILDRTEKKSIWSNPWMMGCVGAGLVAGGLALWWGLGAAPASPATSGLIPPPDVALPK